MTAKSSADFTARAEAWIARWWAGIVIIVTAPLWIVKIDTADLWWHMHLGRWLFTHGTAPDFTQLYFTPTVASVPDLRSTVLGDILLYAVHRVGGDWGIHCLVWACLGCSIWFLRQLKPGPVGAWRVMGFIAVIFATYQLQLPRNAVFSLPFLALIVWIWSRSRIGSEPSERRTIWWMPLALGVWSLMHPSALMGLSVAVLLIFGDIIRMSRNLWKRRTSKQETGETPRYVAQLLVILAVSVFVVTVGHASAWSLLTRPFRHLTHGTASKPDRIPTQVLHAPGALMPDRAAPQAFALDTKEWLNRSIWSNPRGGIQSGDFASPFDRLSYRPIVVSLIFMGMGLFSLVFLRPCPGSMIAPTLAVYAIGLGYFRFTGYAALMTMALWSVAISKTTPRTRWLPAHPLSPFLLTLIAGLAVHVALWTGQLGRWIGKPAHQPGIGRTDTFAPDAYDWVLEAYPDEPCFTTIVTGSYALHHWAGRKRVFIDGFFAPHPSSLWADYREAREIGSPRILEAKYGIRMALIEHGRKDWLDVFFTDRNWAPAAITPGVMVFAARAAGNETHPAMLFSLSYVQTMPKHEQAELAESYCGMLSQLIRNGQLEQARDIAKFDEQLFRILSNQASRHSRMELDELEE